MADEKWIDWRPKAGDMFPSTYRSRPARTSEPSPPWAPGTQSGRLVQDLDVRWYEYQIPAPAMAPTEERPPWIDPQCKFRWGDRVRDAFGRVWFVIHPYDKDATKYPVVIAKSIATVAPYSTEQDLKAHGLWWNNPVDACKESAIELFPEDLKPHFDDRILDVDQPQEQPKTVRVPREIWVNMYPDELLGYAWLTKAEADSTPNRNRTECVHFREVL